ncbi:hypothetical protein F5050DRAFT_1715022 [Lentinula boryana]|uniref:Ubiquitin-like protease family profile domain-containing protein n=1 Tax=Lentinula boryana TaxID=40481 RepID=A0ABQ8Q2F8_9AGAR|nr:hypothetical protein F5050DRAFT_1715022 [Lentinula boryana]
MSDNLKCLPLPSPALIRQLNGYSRDAWMNCAQSVQYAHLENEQMLFPLWVISYWETLLTHFTTIHKPWSCNLAWLKENQKSHLNNSLHLEAEQTIEALSSIPWTAPKMGFTDRQPIHTLWQTLGKNWLDTTVIDSALELISQQVCSDAEASQIIVRNSELITKLYLFGGEEEKIAEYAECTWVKLITEEIFDGGKTLLTIAHLGKLPAVKGDKEGLDHWVPVGVDGQNSHFLYGNSLCGKKTPVIPPILLKALEAWKDHHTFQKFTVSQMNICIQKDNNSCGPNSIACAWMQMLIKIVTHFADDDSVPIVSASEASDMSDIEDSDIKMSSVSAVLDVIDGEFTFQPPGAKRQTEEPGGVSETATILGPLKRIRSENSTSTLGSLSPAAKPDRQSLAGFFVAITPEEKAKADKEEFLELEQEYRDRKKAERIEVGWTSNQGKPIIWAEIEAAAKRAGKPWKPAEIVWMAKLLNPAVFKKLTPQLLGRWIDVEARGKGIYKWRAGVLEQVAHGNAPGGQTT